MLRNIKPSEVEVGMFIHGFVGSWFDHPFWRKKFLLADAADAEKIRCSKVESVIVDVTRGATPAERTPAAIALPAATPITRQAAAPARRYGMETGAPAKSTYRQEVRRANRIVEKSKKKVGSMFEAARLGQAVRIREILPLVDDIRESVERNSQALTSLVRLKTKDEYTFMHSVAVCTLMINMGRQMDLDDETIRHMGVAGLLHDLGKMAVPQDILDKVGRLTDDEMDTIRSHPVRGHALIGENPDIPELARDVCLHHHEKVDGTGYPFGLKGNEISLAARMGAICDVYDAVTSIRPYKDPWTPCMALGRMVGWQGHFDERLLQIFINSLGMFPAGSMVRLNDHRLAIVIDNSSDDAAAIRVLPFYCTSTLQDLDPVELLVTPDRGPQILGIERPEFWHFDDWAARRTRLLAQAMPPSATMSAAA
jgi:HD-GYP domain-containing protein (c-di-GMP phosphodiesterase class II)